MMCLSGIVPSLQNCIFCIFSYLRTFASLRRKYPDPLKHYTGNRKLVFYLLEQPRLNLTCQHQCILSILHTIKPLISPTVSTHIASRINLSNQTWHRPGFAIIRWWLMLKTPIYHEPLFLNSDILWTVEEAVFPSSAVWSKWFLQRLRHWVSTSLKYSYREDSSKARLSLLGPPQDLGTLLTLYES